MVLLLIPELLECAAPDPNKVEELLRLQGLDKSRQKQQKDKMASLMGEHKNAVTLYYTVMGLLMAGCITYYLFLLSANRLGLVPTIPCGVLFFSFSPAFPVGEIFLSFFSYWIYLKYLAV